MIQPALLAAVQEQSLAAAVTDTIVTRAIDGYPQRVILTEVIEKLEQAGWLTRFYRAVHYALAFRKVTGAGFSELLREGLAMKKSQELSWSQVVMAANAPIFIQRAMVDGHPAEGVLPSGMIAGVIRDRPTCAELIERIMAEAEHTLTALAN